MKIAFVIYDGVTALDFIGVYDSLSRVKSMSFDKDLFIDIPKDLFDGILHDFVDEVAKSTIGWCLMIHKVHKAKIYLALILQLTQRNVTICHKSE